MYNFQCQRKLHRLIDRSGRIVSQNHFQWHLSFLPLCFKFSRAHLLFSAVFFFTNYVFMASSKSLSSTEKENQSFGNERDNFAHFGCHSTGSFLVLISHVSYTSLATHHRCQPRGFNLRMCLAPTQYQNELLIMAGLYYDSRVCAALRCDQKYI